MSNFIHTNTNNPVNLDLISSINIYKSTIIQFHSCYSSDVYCLWGFKTEQERDYVFDSIKNEMSTQI
jgi:hypothetical protein